MDMENLRGGVPGNVAGVHIGEFVRGIEQAVRVGGLGSKTALVRAYANWGRPEMQAYSHELLEHGIEPVQIFSFDKNIKNAADIELCVDVLAVAHDSPWIEVFVIASGDGGFVPLIRRLHHLNKYVIVASTNLPGAGIVNALLKSVADEYHQIPITGPAAAVSPVATAPTTSTTAKSLVAAKKPQQGKKKKKPVVAPIPKTVHTVAPPLLVRVSSRDEYLAAVRGLFADGDLGRAVIAGRSEGKKLSFVGTALKDSIEGFSKEEAGFPYLQLVLLHALGTTDYRLVNLGEKVLAVVHADHVDATMTVVPSTGREPPVTNGAGA
nr:NYN domain-containing protein [Arthrobacter silviterrae]